MNKKRRYDKISTYFIENIWIVIPMCITALIFNSMMALIPQLQGRLVDSLYYSDFNLVVRYAIIFVLVVLFVQINRFFKRYLVRVFGNKMTLKMRQVSLTNLLKNDLSYFENNSVGDILNRNFGDIYDITEGIRKMTTEVFDTIVLLLCYLISMFLTDYQASLYSLIFIVLAILIAQFMKVKVYKYTKQYKEYLSINKELTLNKIDNELYYRGFGVSNKYLERYENSISILRKKTMLALLFQSNLQPLYLLIANIGLFPIIYISSIKIINGVYDIGVLQTLIATFLLVSTKASKVGKVFNAYQGFKVSWIRCKNYFKDNSTKFIDFNLSKNELEVNNLTYSYSGNFKLPEVSFKAKQGEIIGICGKVHTGKSTLLKMLTGLYNYQGEVKLSNIELRKLALDSKQYISYCGSKVELFSDSIKNNIELDRQGDLNKALEVSCLANDLEQLGGIESKLTHSNSNISGGQQKRLQTARSLYSATNLILLDDPFQSVNINLAIKMIQGLRKYDSSIVFVSSNNEEILKRTDKIIYLQDDGFIFDTFNNLSLNSEFNKLIKGH